MPRRDVERGSFHEARRNLSSASSLSCPGGASAPPTCQRRCSGESQGLCPCTCYRHRDWPCPR
eukprot:2448770-Alexandrium_andersonii.AAC.1